MAKKCLVYRFFCEISRNKESKSYFSNKKVGPFIFDGPTFL